MKIFIAVLGLASFSLSRQSEARPYLQTLVKEKGLTKLAASPMWRRYFPASREIVPSLDDFFNAELGEGGLQKALVEGGEAVTARLHELRGQWLQKFYPEPTEERVLAVLEEDAELRARMVAFFLAHSMVRQQNLGIPVQQIFWHSFGVGMFVRAIDRADLEGTELQGTLNDFMHSNQLEFVYRGDGDTPHVPGREKRFYHGREDYLLRTNHVKSPSLSGEVLNALWQRGLTAAELTAAIPPRVAGMLLAQNVLPDEDGLFSGYAPNLYFDLLAEPGVIGDFVPSVYEVEAFDLETFIMAEAGEETHPELVHDLLNREHNPASLVQIVQLSRMGYRGEQIAALTYAAREAIIVSGDYSRDAFADRHGTDIAALNELVAETGELVFFLLQQGYAQNSADIQPHHVPAHAEMQQAESDNHRWSALLSNKPFILVRQGQPPREE